MEKSSFVPSSSCENCKIYESCKSPNIGIEIVYNGSISEDRESPIDILYIGDSPTGSEDNEDRPFVGRAGKFFRGRAVLPHVDRRIGLAYAVRCRTLGPSTYGDKIANRAPTKDEIDYCRQYLLDDILKYKPRVIVALGASALEAVGKDLTNGKRMTVTQAKCAPIKVGNTWYLAANHPSMHTNKLRDLTDDYKSLGKVVDRLLTGVFDEENPDIREVSESEPLSKVIEQISKSDIMFYDVETNTWDYGSDYPEMMTVYQRGRRIDVVGVGTSQNEPVWVLTRDQFKRVLQFVEVHRPKIVAFNQMADISFISWDYDSDTVIDLDMDDPFLMFISKDVGKTGNSLEELSMVYRQVRSWKRDVYAWMEAENHRRKKDKNTPYSPPTIADLPWEMKKRYNGLDVYHLMGIYNTAIERGVPECYSNRYIRPMKALSKIQLRGIPCNADKANRLRIAYEKKTDYLIDSLNKSPEVKTVLERLGRSRFNVRSPLECTELLKELEIETGKTEKGDYAKFDRGTRVYLSKVHSLIRRIHVIRTNLDLVSKFLKTLPYYVSPRDGNIHTTYTLGRSDSTFPIGSDPSGGTVTGRISSSSPALHNFKKDMSLRSCFEAPPGMIFAELDYAAAEVRGLAAIAGVKNLIEWFNNGIDPYIMVLSLVENIDYATLYKLYKEESKGGQIHIKRPKVKSGFLGWQYGSGIAKFAATAAMTVQEATTLYRMFSKLFPEVPKYQENLIERAKAGPIITPLGVSRRFGNLSDSHELNQLKNFEIQETMSSITVIGAACPIEEGYLGDTRWETVNVVHDSLWGLLPDDNRVAQTLYNVATLMRNPKISFEFPVKLEVEAKIGRDLGNMKVFDISA